MASGIVVNGRIGIIKTSKYWRPIINLFDKFSTISWEGSLDQQKIENWMTVACRKLIGPTR